MITIDLAIGYLILLAVMGLWGWVRGLRWMMSIGIFTTFGYLLTVQSGEFIVATLNRIYANLPRLLAFATGGSPAAVDPFPPIIPDNAQAPLILRIVLFAALVFVGIFYSWPWEKKLTGWQGNQPSRVGGLLIGLYTAALIISGLFVFWNATEGTIIVPDWLQRVLSNLPNWTDAMPALVTAFGVFVVVLVVTRFDRLLKP